MRLDPLFYTLAVCVACDEGSVRIDDSDASDDDTTSEDSEDEDDDEDDEDDEDTTEDDDPGDRPDVPDDCATPDSPGIAGPVVCEELALGTDAPVRERGFGAGRGTMAMPVVADLDGDGAPEVLINSVANLPGFPKGRLLVVHGVDGSTAFQVADASLAFGAPLAVGDLDGDGSPEIVGVRATGNQSPLAPIAQATYTVAAWSSTGAPLWESETFDRRDFDYGSAPVLADLDHDGSPEIVVGRVILNEDGSTRGVGAGGRGAWGAQPGGIAEGSLVAVGDIDRDGTDEVVTGNTVYSADGATLWDSEGEDGLAALVNLDADGAAERIVSTQGTVTALDDDGEVLWGPVTLLCEDQVGCGNPSATPTTANIVSVAAVGDLDGNGTPEIVVAGGTELVALRANGTRKWTAAILDASGASGASLADLDGDGDLEVVYADESTLYVLNGNTGAVLLSTDDHTSVTLFEYPVIADVDRDGQAEILVAQLGGTDAVAVYGAGADGRWAPAGTLWNQHAYARTTVNDDATIPQSVDPPWATHNTLRAAKPPVIPDTPLGELELQLLETCTAACADDVYVVTVRIHNRSTEATPPGLLLSVIAERAGTLELLTLVAPGQPIAPLSTQAIDIALWADEVAGTDRLWLRVDDDGTGTNLVPECDESDNLVEVVPPFCP